MFEDDLKHSSDKIAETEEFCKEVNTSSLHWINALIFHYFEEASVALIEFE